MGDGNGTGVDLDAGDVRCNIVDTDGLGNLSDTSRGNGDVPRIRNSKNTTTNATTYLLKLSNGPQLTKTPCGHAEHVQAHAHHCNAREYLETRRNVSVHIQ